MKLSKAKNADSARTTLTTKTDDEKEQKLEYTSEDVKATLIPLDAESFVNDYEEYVNFVKLRVKKACFSGDAKWDFIIQLHAQAYKRIFKTRIFWKE